MERGVGEHIIEGTALLAVNRWPGEGVAAQLVDCYTIGPFRTVDQDPEFGLRQMVDMAVKALSPGVNDTSTAIACIDSIGVVLHRLADRRVEPLAVARDVVSRVLTRGPTFESLTATALDEIRRNAHGNVRVLEHLLGMVHIVMRHTRTEARRATMQRHAQRICEVARRTIVDDQDRDAVERVFAMIAASPCGTRREIGLEP